MRQFRGIPAVSESLRNPRPVALRCAVLSGSLRSQAKALRERQIQWSYGQPKVVRLIHQIAKILSANKVSWVVLAIQEARYTKDAIAVSACRIAPEFDGNR